MVYLFLALLVLSVVAVLSLRKRVIQLEDALSLLEQEKKTVYSFLDKLGNSITKGAEVDSTIDLIVEFAQEASRAEAAALYVLERREGVLRAQSVRGMFPTLHKPADEMMLAKRRVLADMVRRATFAVGEGPVGLVAKTGQPVLVIDARNDPELRKLTTAAVPLRDLLAVPLIVRGDILGVLVLVNRRHNTFGETDKSIVISIADQAALTLDMVGLYKLKAERQRIEHELELARTFQSFLLPQERPSIPQIVIGEFYRSARELGGDYYDFIQIDERHLGVVVADVSGKGVPGALIMASVRATLRSQALLSTSPRKVLQSVNDLVARDTKENVFVTMTYGVLDLQTGRFRFCRAGHEPLICYRPGSGHLRLVSPDGIALGLMPGEIFKVTEESEVDLAHERMIVLYTDGVIEAMDQEGQEYGESRLHGRIEQCSGLDPQGLITNIVADLEDFTRGLDQHDDITLVVIGWTGSEPESIVGSPVAATAAKIVQGA